MPPPIVEVLTRFGVHRISGSEDGFLRGLCPFHEHNGAKTFWVAAESGHFGCWSSRCSQHKGGTLRHFLHERGLSHDRAAKLALSLDLRPVTPSDLGNIGPQGFDGMNDGRVKPLHLGLWKVDWQLSERVCVAAERRADPPPEARGRRELHFWRQLGWVLRKRRMSAGVLTRFGVAFDPESEEAIFPFRSPQTGRLRGVTRRPTEDGARYFTTASPYHRRHRDYIAQPVERGSLLWGWSTQSEEIAAGAPIVVVEGQFDALRVAKAGWVAVAKMGSRLTKGQVSLLNGTPNLKMIWPDADPAGVRGARDDALRLDIGATRVIPITAVGKDPDDVDDAEVIPKLSASVAAETFLSAYTNSLAFVYARG